MYEYVRSPFRVGRVPPFFLTCAAFGQSTCAEGLRRQPRSDRLMFSSKREGFRLGAAMQGQGDHQDPSKTPLNTGGLPDTGLTDSFSDMG